MSRGGPPPGVGGTRSDRGQTSIDFLVGIGVFLLTVGFIIGFVPGLLAPFGTAQSSPLVADRVADSLVEEHLVDAPGADRLNETCVVAFVDETLVDGSDCSFDPSEPDLAVRLGIDTGYHLNVSLLRPVGGQATPEPLHANATGIVPPGPDTIRLDAGDPVPTGHDSVVTASRFVHVDGHDAVLVVRLW